MLSAELIKATINVAENDDQSSFQVIFRHFFPGLLSFAESYMKNRMFAEEVVEDVFIKLWEGRKMLPAIKNLNYYLYVATKHAAINYLEKNRKNNKRFDIEELEEEALHFRYTPEDALISSEALREIEHAINTLPTKCRLIFRLIKEEGLRYKEVAELLGISIKTVENQMTIALQKITSQVAHIVPMRKIGGRES